MNDTAQLAALSEQVAWLVSRQERNDELWDELMPVGRQVMSSLAARLDGAEKSGWLAFGRELLAVGERVVEHYSPEDVRRLGDAIVPILDAVRAVTQPEMMTLAADAAGAVEAGAKKPVGMLGAMRATRDEDVQRGLAIVIEVLRRIGEDTRKRRSAAPAANDRQARLAAVLGPRRARTEPRPAPRVAPPAAAPPVPVAVNGVAFGADGYLADSTQWTKPLAESLAGSAGITLGEQHWQVLEAARADFAKTKASPNVRRLTQIQPLDTKQLYALFPKAPGRTVAKLAGLPKPTGCL